MALDLILGRTKRSWARGSSRALACSDKAPQTLTASLPVSDEVTLRLTPKEMSELSDLAATKLLADSGDRVARAKMARVAKKLARVKARASRGDARAKRTLLVLRESGVFRGVKTVSLGDEVPEGLVSNTNYRVAVLRQAIRSARSNGYRRPTTKDFYRAKSAVDGLMDRRGLALYLPRATPGRVTY